MEGVWEEGWLGHCINFSPNLLATDVSVNLLSFLFALVCLVSGKPFSLLFLFNKIFMCMCAYEKVYMKTRGHRSTSGAISGFVSECM